MKKIDELIKDGIIAALNSLDASLKLNNCDIIIEIPKDNANGDYASNVAMKYCKSFQVKPFELAQQIIDTFDLNQYHVKEIKIAGPGFLNFFVDQTYLVESIKNIIALDTDFGSHPPILDYKINVEYVSANPTGDLHLGHARQASLGDSITRLYKKAGYCVEREYYVNDAGNQINNLCYSVIARYHQLFEIDYPIPEDGYHGQDIKDIALMLKNLHQDEFINNETPEAFNYIKQTALTYEIDKLKQDLHDFRVDFDKIASEQALYDSGQVQATLSLLDEKQATFKEEDALWLNTIAYGDDKNRVLIKKDGSYTYLTPDIAYHLQKIQQGNNLLVNLWGADHHGYIKRMQCALKYLTNQDAILEVDIVQMVRLIADNKEVKMSKRTGNAVGLRELCEEVGVDAVRYFFASRSSSSHFDFDLDLAKSRSSDNPVFYAQYAHARICSIISLAQELNLSADTHYTLLNHPKETN
ncbi:MAG: arginine--tRNA ligase, partial [Bacilli bacterium]